MIVTLLLFYLALNLKFAARPLVLYNRFDNTVCLMAFAAASVISAARSGGVEIKVDEKRCKKAAPRFSSGSPAEYKKRQPGSGKCVRRIKSTSGRIYKQCSSECKGRNPERRETRCSASAARCRTSPLPPFGFLTGPARTSDISWSHTLDLTGTSPGAEWSQDLMPVAPGDEVRARQLREHLSAV